MLLARIRLGFLLTTLVASLHVIAEPRFWTLAGVQFEDGAVATGHFSYDNVTGTIANWNVRLSGGVAPFIPWTFVPGNSHEWPTAPAFTHHFYVYSYAPSLVPHFQWRSLVIRTRGPLDGSNSTVQIDVSDSHEFFEDDFFEVGKSRVLTAGALVLTPLPPPLTIVQVDEFYHHGLGQYFITADRAEKQLLDTGVHSGWERTRESFRAYATGSSAGGSILPVCRYYGHPERGRNSHFYSADTSECLKVLVTFASEWLLESDNVFQINVPENSSGTCPAGTIPVYRLWNERNHRYTTKTEIRTQMLADGYRPEGHGADGVVMCAVQ